MRVGVQARVGIDAIVAGPASRHCSTTREQPCSASVERRRAAWARHASRSDLSHERLTLGRDRCTNEQDIHQLGRRTPDAAAQQLLLRPAARRAQLRARDRRTASASAACSTGSCLATASSCGLDVEVQDDGRTSGSRRAWRSTVGDRRSWSPPVPAGSRSLPTSSRSAVTAAGDCKTDACIQVLICYHECLGDPAPVLAGDCRTTDPCAPSTVREQYRIELREECTTPPEPVASVQRRDSQRWLDYGQIARWVTGP